MKGLKTEPIIILENREEDSESDEARTTLTLKLTSTLCAVIL